MKDWKTERFVYAMHISVKKGLQELRKPALLAMMGEIQQLDGKGCFSPRYINSLTKTQMRKIIRSSMFLKEKFDSMGVFEKLKASILAGDDQQNKSPYKDVGSPRVTTLAVFMTAAIAAREILTEFNFH